MTTVSLHSVTLERFQSFRQKTAVVFTKPAGLKFITGRNMVEPRLGANGAGKSTIFEAVTWGLFGVTSNGDRASDVVTWGEKTPRVAVRVLIGDDAKAIVREGSPNRLTIDGKVAEQDDVDRLLGLSKNRFLQTVLFGQGAPLFFDLSVPDRGALLDDVFAISYWAERSEHVGKLEKTAQKEVAKLTNQIAGIEIGLESFSDEHERQLVEKVAGWDSARRQRVELAIAEVARHEDQLILLADQAKAIDAELSNFAMRDVRTLHEDRGKAYLKVRQTNSLIEFYQRAEAVCPTCRQPISREFKETELRRLYPIAKDLHCEIGALDEQLTIDSMNNGRRAELQQQQRSVLAKKDALGHQIDVIQARLEAEAISNSPHESELARFRQVRSKLNRDRSRLIMKRLTEETHLECLRFWKEAFKRVRLYLLKQVLDTLTIEVASAAAALGLPGWQIALATETENKSGTIRSGIQITVTSPDKTSRKRYSGGEHQRIKLAVSIGLANMIQRMAGVTFDFEIWDEPTQFLSEEGISDLLECLSYRAQAEKKSIYLLDHRSLNYGFDETIFIEKTQEGSRVRAE